MNHLMNCHGEWNMLFACASTMPILGVFGFVKTKFATT